MVYWVNMGRSYNHILNSWTQTLAVCLLLGVILMAPQAHAQQAPATPDIPAAAPTPVAVPNHLNAPIAVVPTTTQPEFRQVRNKLTIKRRSLTRAQHPRIIRRPVGQ